MKKCLRKGEREWANFQMGGRRRGVGDSQGRGVGKALITQEGGRERGEKGFWRRGGEGKRLLERVVIRSAFQSKVSSVQPPSRP